LRQGLKGKARRPYARSDLGRGLEPESPPVAPKKLKTYFYRT
jgi:hypothetical protein